MRTNFPSTNTLIKYNGNTDVIGTGTLTFIATCNAANTAWIYSGAEITKWECFEPCQSCPIFPDVNFGPPGNLGTVVPSTDSNGCAVRTYNCNVLPTQTAYITTSNGVVLIQAPGPNSLFVTCNAANTEWLYGAMPITYIQCDFLPCTPWPGCSG
ncbi:hypothetical protein PRIPAC_74082 [Pristionchus pacificus]|uniref:C6 domain-containing protein n=1 Tax=Pristionchus pacificus TaxID=54126 RepID=A0A2A6C628_PRIPA|nr:hypothetical protein PRIPAC_74082 [Pristionchus pacificus]|eukprot:PDM73557.1 hypothetical protein PRIPAC_40913 [Pristionchus pacificus]